MIYDFLIVTFCPEHCIYSASSHICHVTFQNVPHDNFQLITSRQQSSSSVMNPGTCWYFCVTPKCTFDNSKNGKYSYMLNIQFYASSHTHEQALTPPLHQPLPPTRYSSFLEILLTSKINQCPLASHVTCFNNS